MISARPARATECPVRDRRVQLRQKSYVAIENSLSRQALQCFLLRQRNLCRDRLLKDNCRDRVFSIAIESERPHVVTEFHLSRQGVGLGGSRCTHDSAQK